MDLGTAASRRLRTRTRPPVAAAPQNRTIPRTSVLLKGTAKQRLAKWRLEDANRAGLSTGDERSPTYDAYADRYVCFTQQTAAIASLRPGQARKISFCNLRQPPVDPPASEHGAKLQAPPCLREHDKKPLHIALIQGIWRPQYLSSGALPPNERVDRRLRIVSPFGLRTSY